MQNTKKQPKKITTYKFKVYGNKKTFQILDQMGYMVNFIWNYCNEASDFAYKTWMKGTKTPYFTDNIIRYKTDKNKEKQKMIYQGIRIPYFHESNQQLQQLELVHGCMTGYDLEKLLAGSSKIMYRKVNNTDVKLSQSTMSAVSSIYYTMRSNKVKLLAKNKKTVDGKKIKKSKNFIRYRGKKSRLFVPLKGCDMNFNHKTNILTYAKQKFKINVDREIDGKILDGKFVKEHDGWYLSMSLDVYEYGIKKKTEPKEKIIGVDLGLKELATLSNGEKISTIQEPIIKFWKRKAGITEHIRRLQSIENKLKNKRSTRSGKKIIFHSKATKKEESIRNARLKLERKWNRYKNNANYNNSHKLLNEGQTVVIGNLSGKFIQKVYGKKSKQISLGMFKEQIQWIAKKRGQTVEFVNEQNTTITCSKCLEKTGPSGYNDLNLRDWTCSNCGAIHDRDVNAAKNILNVYLNQLDKSDQG